MSGAGLYSAAFSRFLGDGAKRTPRGAQADAPPLPRLTLPPPALRGTATPTLPRLQPMADAEVAASMIMLGSPIDSAGVSPMARTNSHRPDFDKLPTPPKRTKLDEYPVTTPQTLFISAASKSAEPAPQATPSFSSAVTPSPTLTSTDVPSSPPEAGFEFPVAVSNKTSFNCEVCGKDFDRKSNLNKHIRHVHRKERPYTCNLCGKRFGQKSSIDKHHLVVHLKLKSHKCTQCDSSFGQVGDLNVHIRTVHEKRRPFGCATCGATFGLKSHLNKHIRVVHEKMRPYQCDLCSASFGENSDRKKHIQAVHRDQQ